MLSPSSRSFRSPYSTAVSAPTLPPDSTHSPVPSLPPPPYIDTDSPTSTDLQECRGFISWRAPDLLVHGWGANRIFRLEPRAFLVGNIPTRVWYCRPDASSLRLFFSFSPGLASFPTSSRLSSTFYPLGGAEPSRPNSRIFRLGTPTTRKPRPFLLTQFFFVFFYCS